MSNINTTTTGEAKGDNAGDKVKGAFNAVHGGLDKLRGEVLTAADAAGDQISERPKAAASGKTDSNAYTANKGDAELQSGLAKLDK